MTRAPLPWHVWLALGVSGLVMGAVTGVAGGGDWSAWTGTLASWLCLLASAEDQEAR